MDLTVLASLGIFLVGAVGIVFSSSARYLTIREYETFTSFTTREMDLIHNRLLVLEQTRPTTGELEAKLGNKLKDNYDGTSNR